MEIIITKHFESGECQKTRKTDVPCVQMTSEADGIKDGVVSWKELENIVRFRQSQDDQNDSRNGKVAPSTELPFAENID